MCSDHPKLSRTFPSPDPPILAFLAKKRGSPEKSEDFPLSRTFEIFGRERKNARKTAKQKKRGKRKKTRIGRSGSFSQNDLLGGGCPNRSSWYPLLRLDVSTGCPNLNFAWFSGYTLLVLVFLLGDRFFSRHLSPKLGSQHQLLYKKPYPHRDMRNCAGPSSLELPVGKQQTGA